MFFSDGYYHCLASLYENKNDAEHVKTKLAEEEVESEILTIVLPPKVVKGSFNTNEKEIMTDCLESNYQIFRKLYDVAISLDTKICDQSKAKLDCNSIYSQLISTKTNFQTFFKDNFEDVKDNLNKNEKILTDLISENYESAGQTLSSFIKLAYCKILLS